jgi:general secretion pathway protein G
MVVMIILGLLAALVVPRMIGRVDPAKQKAAFAQIELFGTALDTFRLDVGRYPEKLEDLQSQPSGAEGWNGPYLKKEEIPLDPWDNPYQYKYPGEHGDYDLYSLGADRSEGGDGDNMDVVSWKGLKIK